MLFLFDCSEWRMMLVSHPCCENKYQSMIIMQANYNLHIFCKTVIRHDLSKIVAMKLEICLDYLFKYE